MGKVLYHLNRYSEAIVAYERAIQIGSKSVKAEAYRGKGNILKSQAQLAFNKADELDPDPFLPDYPDDIS
jgi:cytochrome c-type biogenesis protein CcmH/NrfG